MKKVLTSLSTVVLGSALAYGAQNVMVGGYEAGEIELKFKGMTVLSDKKNGFTPSNGTAYLIKLKYQTGDILTEGLSVGVGMYANGDAGLTTWDERSAPNYNKPAMGMVVDVNGSSKALTGELYLDYKYEFVHARAGRQILKTPLTVIKTSLMPNFYEAYMLDAVPTDGLKITAGHISKVSFGSRAMADWGVIGEKTGTAGVGLYGRGVLFEQAGGTLQQAKFYNIGTAAGFESTNGRSLLGVSYTGIDNLFLDGWVYHSYDIVTDYYAEIKYTIPITKKSKFKLQGQYLYQQDTGKALSGQRDFNLYGAKVSFGSKKYGLYAAFNQSGKKDDDPTNLEGQFFNAWGADPGYTSSIFSRNEYREDVTAYKVGAHYVFIKGLKLMISYANYGQSATSAGNSPNPDYAPRTDAYEIDTVLVYKPNKHWMFKVFNSNRASEYDGLVVSDVIERKMDHYRFIASYTF